MTITAFPLTWPTGWKRTPDTERAFGRFGNREQRAGRSYASLENITIVGATKRLLQEMERMAVRPEDVILSTDLQLRQDGQPRSGQAAPRDPGAAIYWNDPFNGQPRSMAIDRYTKVEMNIAALAATIEAMRAIERHGGAVVLERAFTGFAALPAPIVAGMKRDWWVVLDCSPNSARSVVEYAYRRLAAKAHPDKGGSDAAMSELNTARDEALKECTP